MFANGVIAICGIAKVLLPEKKSLLFSTFDLIFTLVEFNISEC